MVREPLTVAEYRRRPTILRGRYLFRGVDLETGLFRQFYLNNTREMWQESWLRIALYALLTSSHGRS